MKEEEVEELRQANSVEVETMNGSSYTPEFINLVWKLQSKNVPFHHISSVISDCWEFVDKKATNLPTEKTLSSINLSRLAAGQKQMEV